MKYFAHETAIIDDGAEIGDDTKVWHFTHVMPKAKLGKGCNLGQNVFVASNVILGDNVKVQNNVSIYEGVECEQDVFLGPSMVFTNISTPRSAIIRKGTYEKTLVKIGASVGANATIVCGHEIGAYAFIAAGAVVTKNIPDYALVMGVPGKIAGWVSEYGHTLEFGTNNRAICPESKDEYIKISENKIQKVAE